MRQLIRHSIMAWLLLLVGNAMLMAQTTDDDDFNPSNPPEPKAKFKIEVLNTEYAYTSGSGSYYKGEDAYISTSANNENYQFAYWKKDGERYTDEQNFSFKMEDRNVVFEAIYEYVPVNPQEPSKLNTYRLFLETDDQANCSFNRNSGDKIEAGSTVWLSAYLGQGYVFKGWYQGDQLISTEPCFEYTMPAERVTLTARIDYCPTSPSDPSGTGQGNVENGILNPILTTSTATGRIYTLDGKEVRTPKTGHLYIINHKKVVIRR